MAELWADNYLIIDVRSDSSNSGSILVAERNEGECSFEAMDKIAAEFGDQGQFYLVITIAACLSREGRPDAGHRGSASEMPGLS